MKLNRKELIIIKKNILFICTGNTCRSPFAEFMMRNLLTEKLGENASNMRISSAGTYAFSGVQPPPDAIRAAKELGLDMSAHRSRSIHLSMLEAADIVICMTAMHKAHLVARFPWFEDRIFILKKYAEGAYREGEMETSDDDFDIPDPIGKGPGEYKEVYSQIRSYLEKVITLWQTEDKFRKSVSRTFRIILGSDHAGFNLKKALVAHLKEQNHTVIDAGVEDGTSSADYSDYARPVAEDVASKKYDFGILCCGSGVGMSIAANRVRNCRAVLARDALTAKLSRQHNNTNVLCLGERFTTDTVAIDILNAWLGADFEGGRHTRRIKKIEGPGEV